MCTASLWILIYSIYKCNHCIFACYFILYNHSRGISLGFWFKLFCNNHDIQFRIGCRNHLCEFSLCKISIGIITIYIGIVQFGIRFCNISYPFDGKFVLASIFSESNVFNFIINNNNHRHDFWIFSLQICKYIWNWKYSVDWSIIL